MVEYRLDRMDMVRVSDSKATCNDDINHHVYDEAIYEYFGRFGGDEVIATLKVRVDKVEVVMDRFGKAAELSRIDDEFARARVRIRKSERFFGWIAGMGKAVTIAGPKSRVDNYRNYLTNLLNNE